MNKSKGIIFLKVAVALLALYLLYFFLMASAPIIAFILILVLFLLPAVGFFLVSRKKAEIDLLKIQHDEIMQQIEYRKTEFDHLCTAQKDEMDNKNKDLIIEVTAKEEQLKDLTAKVNELKHEKETLEQVTSLRTNSYDDMSMEQKISVNEQVSQGISKLLAVAENYPDLKASQNFSDLSKELSNVENDIANSRKYYNGTVRNLNNKVQMFPSNIIANIFNFKAAKMFEIVTEERNNVKVDFKSE